MTYNHPQKLETTYRRLEGKSVLVTGATSGIGEAAVRLFAEEGARVVAAARREDRLTRLVEDLRENGHKAAAVACDVSDEASVRAAVQAVRDNFDRIDLAFNNAGVGGAGAVHETSAEDFDRIIAVNLRGVFLCMKHEIAAMLEQGDGGSIVNTSSIGGLIGVSSLAAYSTSKWGVAGLTKAAAAGYGPQGIRVNAIAPGSTRSEMFDSWMPTEEAREEIAASSPMNYIAHPDDMARVALFLLSDEARWTTGAILPAKGGSSAGV
ncbi:SDR family oxidoreductase [Martelella lutilitoris]|uniref:SDR family oxidoreductase n=1 Tax=Martelella lutilitoris TaxID=2583532 RepID=A0A5C4JQ15_9HYPH|nr:SDR family oxidoreductase [Martelella lutilitoris]TNB47496.1 SDR family oxidoreductase [Martelella lutilitoris]